MSREYQEQTTVTCPNCKETVTISIYDQTCAECESDISDLQSQLRRKVREVKRLVREVVEQSKFELRTTNLQEDVIRVDVVGDGPFLLDSVDMSTADLEPITDRQQDLSSLLQEIRSIEGVAGIEEWYAESPDRGQGSKYGMKPDLAYRDEGEVTLLVGTSVQL